MPRCSITIGAVSQLSPEIHRILYMKQIFKTDFPKGVIFQKKMHFHYSSSLQYPQTKLKVQILHINRVTQQTDRILLSLLLLHVVLIGYSDFRKRLLLLVSFHSLPFCTATQNTGSRRDFRKAEDKCLSSSLTTTAVILQSGVTCVQVFKGRIIQFMRCSMGSFTTWACYTLMHGLRDFQRVFSVCLHAHQSNATAVKIVEPLSSKVSSKHCRTHVSMLHVTGITEIIA